MLSQIFGGTSFGGSRFEFTEEIRGEFPEDGELEVGVWTSNGRIHVETWDEPGYLLTVIKKIRAQDEDEARQVLENCYEFSQERLSLKVKATDKHGLDFRGLSVGFSLKVPASRKASLTLKSANGRVTADKLNGSSCLMGTANGRVVASGCGFDKVRLSTANGRIEYEGTAGELDASTANGSVNAELKGAGDWRFSSANGRISINVSKDANAAYELDLSARAGGITVEGMDDAEVAEDVAVGRHRRRYKARSRGFENAGVKGRIRHDRQRQDPSLVLKGEPGMQEERMRILQMLKEGKITVDESLKLLEALEPEAAGEPEPAVQTRAKWLRIRITERGKDKPKVMVTLPVGLVDWALRTGSKFASLGGADLGEMGIDLNQLRAALVYGGMKGKIIDVMDDEEGQRVEIELE